MNTAIPGIRDADLLGRPETLLPASSFGDAVEGKRVMVIGAGGSIGSAVAERAAECRPERLILATNTENHLYGIETKLAHLGRRALASYLLDIRHRERVLQVIRDEHPDVVIHAAALKHIPICETNPTEAILTNYGGTKNVVDACLSFGVGRVVFLSTDKAVHPSSVMGATKRAAELYCLAQQEKTKVRVARLVNVLGSSGSVVPYFWSLIQAGKAPTVTNAEMSRYFMTHAEAADLLLYVAGLPDNAARLFVPRPGGSVRIMDLAQRMVRLSGKEVGPVVCTGMRPGEKVAEEMVYPVEETATFMEDGSPVREVHSSRDRPDWDTLTAMHMAAQRGDGSLAMELLQSALPEYTRSP